jgi:Glycosyl hydrolase family 79 C-terminal beta domain
VNRRRFLWQGGSVAAAAVAWRAVRGAAEAAAPLEVTLREDAAMPVVPADFTGLSYELAQLTDANFFSAKNRELVGYFRLLSGNGVLRLGGNTSEFCWLKTSAATPAPTLHVPPGNLSSNWMPHELFAIEPRAIDELSGFLKATGWRLIYGLNFGNSTPERAADEAAYVAKAVGERLEYFQIGNEPDLYTEANNGTRPPDWTFTNYVEEWMDRARAIGARVPAARFGGPDVAASSDWILRFNKTVQGERLAALTGHYYAEGPPDDPQVTIARLLAGNAKVAAETAEIVAAARAERRVYRMTEGNSCYRGGKPGMSDAFAAALWAGDYLLTLASNGCAGANLHGGQSRFLTAGLGGHTPGLDVAKGPQEVRSGFYTPIRSEPGAPVKAMPVFYGMLLVNQFAGCTMLRCDYQMKGASAVAMYAGRTKKEVRVAVFNKDARMAVDVMLRGALGGQKGNVWRLAGPRLDATEGVTLAGAEIAADAKWSPRAEIVDVNEGAVRVQVPAASAALLMIK